MLTNNMRHHLAVVTNAYHVATIARMGEPCLPALVAAPAAAATVWPTAIEEIAAEDAPYVDSDCVELERCIVCRDPDNRGCCEYGKVG